MSTIQTLTGAMSPETFNTVDLEQLWAGFAQNRDLELRNQLMMHYLGLVKRVVSRLYAATRDYHEYDDLVSCGIIGLMDAFERFDPTRGIRFETYAQIRIRGEIVDHMRRQDWAPSQLRLRIRHVEQAVCQLAQTLGRTPSDPEIAAFLDMDLNKLQALFGEAHSLNIVHLDELLAGNDEGVASSSDAGFDRAYERQEIQAALLTELQQLPERERLILSLYYDEELTQREIGQVLKLTESRISQILSSTLLKLRARLNGGGNLRKARKQA